MEQPGSPPRIVTLTDPDDLAALVADVGAARDEADVVVVTPHWGLHFTPGAIADYESEVGRAAIDAGADIILGHHQHILKPIQVYKGKVIFHGMGNFAVDVDMRDYRDSQGIKELVERYPGWESNTARSIRPIHSIPSPGRR
jgi:poly-gamma-glutamate synthesis protein (capsule biosynthesis protein)